MLPVLTAAAASALVPAAVTCLRTRWESRDIHTLGGWARASVVAAVLALLAFAATVTFVGTAPAAALAVATGMAAITIATDLRCYKAPRELPHIVAAAGLLAFATTYTTAGAISAALTFVGIVVLPFLARALTRGGLGFSDVRILWAFTATLSWWTGPVAMVWALIGACLLQLTVRVIAPTAGWGRRADILKDGEPTGRTRWELPFAPALCTAYVATGVYAALTGITACGSFGAC